MCCTYLWCNEKSLGKKRCVPSREALAEIHLVHVLGSILSLKCSVVSTGYICVLTLLLAIGAKL